MSSNIKETLRKHYNFIKQQLKITRLESLNSRYTI